MIAHLIWVVLLFGAPALAVVLLVCGGPKDAAAALFVFTLVVLSLPPSTLRAK